MLLPEASMHELKFARQHGDMIQYRAPDLHASLPIQLCTPAKMDLQHQRHLACHSEVVAVPAGAL